MMKNQGALAKKGSNTIMTTPVSDAESDRRLRPVMDALYGHKTKQAMKLVQQAIQKRPGWPAARALRACIYLQMERWEDAKQEMDEIRSDLEERRAPNNEDAARKIHLYYQEIRREDLAGEIYEWAWKANPTELHFAENAFCLYMRGNAFSQAQKIATKLHRLTTGQSQKYVFWATAALWLGVTYQARSLTTDVSQLDTRMLKLGCAMMSKALDESANPPSAEMVRFAARVFKQSGDYDNAIKLVSHPRLVMDENEVLHLRGDIAFASSKDPTDYYTLLTEYVPNDWGYWLRYFECVKQKDGWVDDADELIDNILKAKYKFKEPLRGCYLARMEICCYKKDWKGLSDSVIHYFDVFGDKAVVSRDLRPWLVLLQEQDLHNFVLDRLIALGEERGFPHHLHLCWLKLWFGRLNEMPEELIERYVEQRMTELEPTDRQPGDDYLLLSAHKLLPLKISANRYEDMVAVLKTIILLEAGLKWSPFNHDFKLLLIRLYYIVGGMDKLFELWESLDVKHVQLSTLTHIVLSPLFETGHHRSLQTILESVESLWREIDREIPECTTRAIHDGSLNAAVDFVLFKLRLERSVILAEAMVAEAHLNLIISGGEPVGVKRVLISLTTQSKFTLDDLSGTKRMISNEDSQCYRFWDYDNYDKNSRLETLQDEFLEEGVTCHPARLQTLRADLTSLVVLLRLAEENGNEGVQKSSSEEIAKLITNDLTENKDVSRETRLRLKVVANLVKTKVRFDYGADAHSQEANGNAKPESLSTNRLVCEAEELAEELSRVIKDIVQRNSSTLDSETDPFPQKLRNCCKMAFNVFLPVAVCVSSFSPILAKGQRKAKKSGAKRHPKFRNSSEFLEDGRKIILKYRDEILSATSMIQSWITECIDSNLDWAEKLVESEEFDDLPKLVSEDMCRLKVDDAERSITIERSDICKEVVATIRSSQSVSCSALLETLTVVKGRLQLADL